MTVAELINILKLYRGECPVVINCHVNGFDHLESVRKVESQKISCNSLEKSMIDRANDTFGGTVDAVLLR